MRVGHLAEVSSRAPNLLPLGRVAALHDHHLGERITASRDLLSVADQTLPEQSSSLASIIPRLHRIGLGGDTVSDLTRTSARALELQASAEEVARSMDVLFQSVEKTSSSTTEMNASMNEMSRRTEVLAGIGDEVLSFVSEMDSTVSELLSSSESTAQLAQQVRRTPRGRRGGEPPRGRIKSTNEMKMTPARSTSCSAASDRSARS